MNCEKIEALIKRTVDECENEGFTISEAISFALRLKTTIDEIAVKDKHNYLFRDFQTAQKTD